MGGAPNRRSTDARTRGGALLTDDVTLAIGRQVKGGLAGRPNGRWIVALDRQPVHAGKDAGLVHGGGREDRDIGGCKDHIHVPPKAERSQNLSGQYRLRTDRIGTLLVRASAPFAACPSAQGTDSGPR